MHVHFWPKSAIKGLVGQVLFPLVVDTGLTVLQGELMMSFVQHCHCLVVVWEVHSVSILVEVIVL